MKKEVLLLRTPGRNRKPEPRIEKWTESCWIRTRKIRTGTAADSDSESSIPIRWRPSGSATTTSSRRSESSNSDWPPPTTTSRRARCTWGTTRRRAGWTTSPTIRNSARIREKEIRFRKAKSWKERMVLDVGKTSYKFLTIIRQVRGAFSCKRMWIFKFKRTYQLLTFVIWVGVPYYVRAQVKLLTNFYKHYLSWGTLLWERQWLLSWKLPMNFLCLLSE